MTKDELEQRVNDARARNAEGTCSDDWHKMVEYELRVEIERLRVLREGGKTWFDILTCGQTQRN